MLARLVSNSRTQAICLPQLPKVLGTTNTWPVLKLFLIFYYFYFLIFLIFVFLIFKNLFYFIFKMFKFLNFLKAFPVASRRTHPLLAILIFSLPTYTHTYTHARTATLQPIASQIAMHQQA